MSFCDLCSGLTIEKLYPPNVYYHAKTPTALKQSGQSCRLCAFMHWCIIRVDNMDCFPSRIGSSVPGFKIPRLEEEAEPNLKVPKISPFTTPEPSSHWYPWELEEFNALGPMPSSHRYDPIQIQREDARSPSGKISLLDQQSQLRLQILPEPASKDLSHRGDANGFAYIGMWLKSGKMLTDMTLAVEQGDILGSSALVMNDVHKYICGRLVTGRSLSAPHFDLARRWLKRCDTDHPRCQGASNSDPTLPERVIHVKSDPDGLRLVKGLGRRAQYVTLTHCWGKMVTPLQTTTQNLPYMEAQISFDKLPKSFQDAVVVCRELGISYLWIDTLCILQDSQEDWERQSGLMGAIYYDSTLTLAASGAFDSSDGLFIPNESRDYVALPRSFGNSKGQAYACPSSWTHLFHSFNIHRCHPDTTVRNALSTRGWAYQEQVLARRTLKFMQGAVVWTCGEYTWEQGGVSMVEDVSTRRDLEKLQKIWRRELHLEGRNSSNHVTAITHNNGMAASRIMRPDGSVDLSRYRSQDGVLPIAIDPTQRELYDFADTVRRFGVYQFWYNAVHRYCCRDLTFQRDKLPALAGIASRIQSITGDDYLAGHWRRELGRSLFWRVEYVANSAKPDFPSRVRRYRAPTWSWASIDGFVRWDTIDATSLGNELDFIEILHASVEVQGHNPFGQVAQGRITLRAAVIYATRDWTKDRAWVVDTAPASHNDSWISHECSCRFSEPGKGLVGSWIYDDLASLALPEESLRWVQVLQPTYQTQHRQPGRTQPNLGNHKFKEQPKPTIPNIPCNIPWRLLLVKGSLSSNGYTVLVLASTGSSEHEYRRIGLGRLETWNTSIEESRIITIV